jgi:MFS family permease
MDDDPALGDRHTATDGQNDGQADGQAAPEASHPTLRRWRDPQVVGLALMAMSAGFGQFGVVAALGDVARTFGRLTSGASLADQAGLSGTKLGLGLAIIRLASLAGLPLAGLADRVGRRKTLIAFTAVGLAITGVSAASPGYWWFVVIFALGRPMLSATNALAGVSAAEETSSRDRAKAVALIAAGYGIGTGLVAFIHGLLGSQLGFRGVVGLALVPLALLPLVARRVEEPDRFARQAVRGEHGLPVLGAIAPAYRRRLVIVSIIAFALSIITGPANSFVYLYAENVVHVSGAVTSAMVAAAGVTGLCGLLLGRYLADHLGRRPTTVIAMVAMAGLGVLTYSGSAAAVVTGYVLGVLAASTIAPAAGAYINELFPTSVRASVAGWQIAAGTLGAVTGLLAFGAIADVGNRFGTAAAATFLPALAGAFLLLLLPETRNRELEDLWPEVIGPS